MSLYGTRLAVDGDTGEVSYMLVGARQLVEERRLTAVLVAHEGKRNLLIDDPLVFMRLQFEGCGLAVAWVLIALMAVGIIFIVGMWCVGLAFFARPYFNFFSVGKSECQFVILNKQFHRVAHRSIFFQFDFLARNDAHIEEVLSQGTLTSNSEDFGCMANFQFS